MITPACACARSRKMPSRTARPFCSYFSGPRSLSASFIFTTIQYEMTTCGASRKKMMGSAGWSLWLLVTPVDSSAPHLLPSLAASFPSSRDTARHGIIPAWGSCLPSWPSQSIYRHDFLLGMVLTWLAYYHTSRFGVYRSARASTFYSACLIPIICRCISVLSWLQTPGHGQDALRPEDGRCRGFARLGLLTRSTSHLPRAREGRRKRALVDWPATIPLRLLQAALSRTKPLFPSLLYV